MAISEQTYVQVALEDSDHQWELVCGHLREKPWMTIEHQDVQERLYRRLGITLDATMYAIRSNSRLHVETGSYYVPDLFVVPRRFVDQRKMQSEGLIDAYADATLLVVEIWSPSTGGYDARTKVPGYRARGDLEIWFIHPYERTLTRWLRQPDGTYGESTHRSGVVQPVHLPNVTIDLDELFV